MEKKKQKATMPKEIIVTLEEEGTENEYFSVSLLPFTAAEMGVKKLAGLYVLKETQTIEGVMKTVIGDQR